MKSLKDQVCLDIVRRSTLTLREFAALINNPTNLQESTLAEVCGNDDSPVWKFLIDRDYTPTLLLARRLSSFKFQPSCQPQEASVTLWNFILTMEFTSRDQLHKSSS
jgi:hypothetical protein